MEESMSSGSGRLLLVVLVTLMAVLAGAGEVSDQEKVLQAVQRQLQALGSGDLDVVRDSFASHAVISESRWSDGEWQQSVAPAAERVIARMTRSIEDGSFARFVETIDDPDVRIAGGVAQVTATYQFVAESGYTATGVDMWQLVKIDGQWKVTAIAYSHRSAGVSTGS
jgi:hypothetical protein